MARTLSKHVLIVPGEVISSGDLLSNARAYLALLLGPSAACLLWLLPLGLDAVHQKTLAIVLFMIVYWIAEPVDHAITALIGCYLFWALGTVKFSIAFSGFASATPWFLFGGALMAEAVTSTGLAKRLGFQALSTAGTSYMRLLFGIAILSVFAAPLIPSATARIVIIAPLLIGVLSAMGSSTRSNLAKGSFLALTMMSMLIDKMILAGATPVLAQGIIKEQTGREILWGEWFIAFLPATALTCIAVAGTAYWLFPACNSETADGEEYLQKELRRLGSLSINEKKLLVVLGCAIAAWATDYIHHLEPTVIALGTGLFLVLPKIGVLETGSVKKVNFLVIIFSAGALSMANVLAQTGSLENLNSFVAGRMGAWLSDGVTASISLYWGGVLYHFIFPNNQSLLSTSLPLLLSATTEMPVNSAALGLIWQYATGGTLFAYQSSILVMGYSYGCFNSRDLLKYGALLTFIQGLILMLIVPIYWPLVGLGWPR